jgi:sulfatase modifying factor 1
MWIRTTDDNRRQRGVTARGYLALKGSAVFCAFAVAAGCSGDAAKPIDASPVDAVQCGDPQRVCPLNCGPMHDQDCCESILVPGGTFFRNYDVGSDGVFSDNTHPATVSAFKLDKYEVTVGRYRAFLEANLGTARCAPADGAGAHAVIPGSGWDKAWNDYLPPDKASHVEGLTTGCMGPQFATWTDQPGPNEAKPLNCVSWFDAMAFCIWDGGYLSTDAEWNYAAAGGDEQRVFAWSVPPDSTAVNCTNTAYNHPGCTFIVDAGSKPAGDARWGHSDMGGNVYEWNLDWFACGINPSYIDPCDDCARVQPDPNCSMAFRLHRGGTWGSMPQYLRVADDRYNGDHPDAYESGTGFRCARAL